MNTFPRLALIAAGGLLLGAITSGCVVPGGYGGGGGVDVGVGVDYYEPAGPIYGGWGPGYRVGPVRDGYVRHDGGRPVAHAYRAAPAGRSAPSIPSRGRR